MNQKQYERINKKAISCMRLNSLIIFIILALCYVITRLTIQEAGEKVPVLFDGIGLAFLAVVLIGNVLVAPKVRWLRYRYAIDSEAVDVKQGLWIITRTLAPIERIHQVEIVAGPIDRMFGLAKVVATTAGGTVIVRFLEKEVADQIAEDMQQRIKEIVEEQKGSRE